MQLTAGAAGISVATIGEAEVFVEHGCDDILIAYPLWVDDTSAVRLRDVARKARLAIGVDSVQGAGRAGLFSATPTSRRSSRSTPASTAAALPPGTRARSPPPPKPPGWGCAGCSPSPGHSYALDGPPGRGRRGAPCAGPPTRCAPAGVEPTVVSGGSTPSLERTDTDVVTELRPGSTSSATPSSGSSARWSPTTSP